MVRKINRRGKTAEKNTKEVEKEEDKMEVEEESKKESDQVVNDQDDALTDKNKKDDDKKDDDGKDDVETDDMEKDDDKSKDVENNSNDEEKTSTKRNGGRSRRRTNKKEVKKDKEDEEEEEEKPKKVVSRRRRKRVAVDHVPKKSTASKRYQPYTKRSRRKIYEEVETHWTGWKDIYLVGTELDQYDEAYKIDWDFDHLEDEIFEKEVERIAELKKNKGKDGKKEDTEEKTNYYLFGSTEPQLISGKGVHIPVIIAVESKAPPPSKLGITSVTMEKEEIVSMEKMKMKWFPYIPKNLGNTSTILPSIYILKCGLRKSSMNSMKEELKRKYQYCMPYFRRPSKLLNDDDVTTTVTGICEIAGRGVPYDFDWEMDDFKEYIDELCEDNDVKDEKQKEKISSTIKEHATELKKKNKAKQESNKALYDSYPEAERKALEEAKFYKFYPQNEDPNLEKLGLKSTYINRYYGKAEKLY